MMGEKLAPLKWSFRLTVLLLLGSCGEQPYRHYASVAEAIAAGEHSRGWLPGWLPRSATNVHIQGDLDTNDWWIRAELSRKAADSLRTLLSEIAAERVKVRKPRRGNAWWFEGLVQQQPSNDAALNAELFCGTGVPVESTTVIAFDRASTDAFIWTWGTQ